MGEPTFDFAVIRAGPAGEAATYLARSRALRDGVDAFVEVADLATTARATLRRPTVR